MYTALSRNLARAIPIVLTLGLLPAHASQPTTGLNLGLTCKSGQPMWMTTQIRATTTAVVMKFLSRTAALQHIATSEATSGGTIDPAYTNNQRVMVQLRSGQKILVLVPTGMVVQIGEVVTIISGHADPNNLCSYIPNLIVPSVVTPPQ